MSELCQTCAAHNSPAMKAASLGHVNCLRTLEKLHKLLDARDSTGATPLHAAVRTGSLECAKYLVERAGVNIYVADDVGGTPAHHAAYHGQLECLKWIVNFTGLRAAQISAIDGGTPLHFAASRGKLDCLNYLLDEVKVDVNERDNNGTIPLYFAAQEGHLAIAKALVAHGGDPLAKARDGMCPVHAAAQGGRLDTLKFLVSVAGPRCVRFKDNDGATPIHFSSAKGHVDCLRYLLSQPGATGEERDGIQATPAHDAAEQGHLESLKVLVEFNADINLHDSENLRPWDLAKAEGHEECANYIESVLARKKVERNRTRPPPSPDVAEYIRPFPVISDSEAAQAERDLFVALDDLSMHMHQMAAVSAQLRAAANASDTNISPTKARAIEVSEELAANPQQASVIYQSQVDVARVKPAKRDSSSPSKAESARSSPGAKDQAVRRTNSQISRGSGFVPIKEALAEDPVTTVNNKVKFEASNAANKDDATNTTSRTIDSVPDSLDPEPSLFCGCFWRRRRPQPRFPDDEHESSSSTSHRLSIRQAKSQRLRKSRKQPDLSILSE